MPWGVVEGSRMNVPFRALIFKPVKDPQVLVIHAGTRRAGLPAVPPCLSNLCNPPRDGECPRIGVCASRRPALSHPGAHGVPGSRSPEGSAGTAQCPSILRQLAKERPRGPEGTRGLSGPRPSAPGIP